MEFAPGKWLGSATGTANWRLSRAMSKPLIDDCFQLASPTMRHAAAVTMLAARVHPIVDSESVPLERAVGRMLASPALAQFPVPSHTNSAVDGFAFAHAAYPGPDCAVTLRVKGRAAAGHPYRDQATAAIAVRIFTGAVVPEGLDTVVMQEDVELGGGTEPRVTIPAGLKSGANVRRAGEDVEAGAVLFNAGEVLRPQDLAALASIGLADVECYRRLKVAVVSTGDEVIRAGSGALQPGQVFDANAPMLRAFAALAGAEVSDLGIWPDRADVVRDGLADCARRFDVVLTSGGASRGEEDHMAAALGSLGTRHFWQIQVKPGRPMMLGQIGNSVVVGLPGNPVAVFVCFLMYVWPVLHRLGGGAWREPRRLLLPAAFAFRGRKTGRREFWRGRLIEGPQGLAVDKYKRDGSGLISSLRESDCLIDIPEETGDIEHGDLVAVIPFTEFGIAQR